VGEERNGLSKNPPVAFPRHLNEGMDFIGFLQSHSLAVGKREWKTNNSQECIPSGKKQGVPFWKTDKMHSSILSTIL
jgi:hypothetical protein